MASFPNQTLLTYFGSTTENLTICAALSSAKLSELGIAKEHP
jgi:hypothetical protein